jgi:acyl-CoA synthetase (AMP-forming)/AMP-acid ligase II
VLLDGSPRGSEGVPASAHTWAAIRADQQDLPLDPAPGGAGASGDEHETALTIYTSGTTGRPKGVMLSHHNLIANLQAAQVGMPLYPDDSILVVVPLHFIHGRMQLLAHALVGGTLVFSRGFHLPQAVLAEMVQHRVRAFSGVPYHYVALLDRSSLARTKLPRLRYVLVTGGNLSPSALERLAAALPGVEIHLAYGQTEAAPRVTHLGPADLLSHPGSCGRPLPGVQVDLLDDAGAPVPDGAIGEIVVSGPNVMRGYVSGDAVECGALDEQGRLHTGDLARRDGDGFLYLSGRRSEMIKQAGERIFPREIEEVLDAHPTVAEAAVLGVPDPLYGEAVVALVVPQAPPARAAQPRELLDYCRGTLSYVRSPRRVQLVKRLPKTSSGKIDRGALPRLVEPGSERRG